MLEGKGFKLFKIYLYLTPLLFLPFSVLLFEFNVVFYRLYMVTYLVLILGNKFIVKTIAKHNEENELLDFISVSNKVYNVYIIMYVIVFLYALYMTFLYSLPGGV